MEFKIRKAVKEDETKIRELFIEILPTIYLFTSHVGDDFHFQKLKS